MADDASNIEKLYKNHILKEHKSFDSGDKSDDPIKRYGVIRPKGFIPKGFPSKPEFPKLRKITPPKQDEQQNYEDYSSEEEFPREEQPKSRDLSSLKEEDLKQLKRLKNNLFNKFSYFGKMKSLKKLEALADNRSLGEKVLNDLFSFSLSEIPDVDVINVGQNGDPIFSVDKNKVYQVELPYGPKTEELKYIRIA